MILETFGKILEIVSWSKKLGVKLLVLGKKIQSFDN